MSRNVSFVLLATAAVQAGCVNLAPDYQRSPLAVPAEGRAAAQDVSEMSWWAVYADERLRERRACARLGDPSGHGAYAHRGRDEREVRPLRKR